MAIWLVYILRCRDGSLYTGITTDLAKRVAAHNAGKGAKYTRARLPATLVWSVAMKSATDARKAEFDVKQMTKGEKEKLIGNSLQVSVIPAKAGIQSVSVNDGSPPSRG